MSLYNSYSIIIESFGYNPLSQMDEEWNIPLQINKEREGDGGSERDREKEREMERCKVNIRREAALSC